MQVIYVDTYYFQGYLWGEEGTDEKEDATENLNKLKYEVGKYGIKVKIPFIVLGELTNNLIKEEFERTRTEGIMQDFFRLRKDLDADIVPPDRKCYFKTQTLIKEDSRLIERDPTDCLIALCALCDPYSTYLLMPDTSIIGAHSLTKIEKDMRENGERNEKLHITYSYV
ncbi:MAG: hypothetical protein JW878_00875 [Methanomicrobia archaeon]|nr:hypothetical protein [Methanomicrobia archaeon]